MNILMNPNNQLTNDILSLLKSMNLEPAWMNKAEGILPSAPKLRKLYRISDRKTISVTVTVISFSWMPST